MSRLEWLQMKRACASYGPPLTPNEQIELFRLEANQHRGLGRTGNRVEEPTERSSFVLGAAPSSR